MSGTNDLKQRIKSIKDTYHITKAMELISVSKMKKSLKRYEDNAVFFKKVRETIKDILLNSKDISHRYTKKREGSRAIYVVIASDKGLAGGYNHNVLNAAWEHMQGRAERHIITVGHLAREFFQSKNVQIDLEFTHIAQNPTMNDARRAAFDILNLYDHNLADEVYIVYTKLITTMSQRPEIFKLLPVSINEMQDVTVERAPPLELSYDPSPTAVLDVLIPQYVLSAVFATLVQSVASEHCARMTAMNTASKNAEDMLSGLSLQYNRARQEKVTSELLETVSMNLLKNA